MSAELAAGGRGERPGCGSDGQRCPRSPAKPKRRPSLLPAFGGCLATAAQGSAAGVEPETRAGGDAVTQGSAGGKPEDKGAFPQGSAAAVVLGGKSQGPAEVCWDEAPGWERGSPPAAGTGTQGSAAPAQAGAAGSALGFTSERRREAVGEGNGAGHGGMLSGGDVPRGPWLPAAPPGREEEREVLTAELLGTGEGQRAKERFLPPSQALAARELPPPGISHGSADVWLQGAGAGPNISASSRIEDCEQKGNKEVREAQEPSAGCVTIQAPSAVPGFSSSYPLPPLPPCPGQSPPRLSAAGSSPLAKPSPPAGTRDGAHELSNPAASTFSGDRPSTGAATASQEVPAPEQTAAPGPSLPGERSTDSPEHRKRSRRRSKAAFWAPVPQREAQEQGERSARGCGAQVPSRAPLCSARARAAIAFLRLCWKLEEVASANRGNWVTFQLALSSRDCSEVPVLATTSPAAPRLPAQHPLHSPSSRLCLRTPAQCPYAVEPGSTQAPLQPLPQLLPLPHHLPRHLGWHQAGTNPKLGTQHLPREVFGDSSAVSGGGAIGQASPRPGSRRRRRVCDPDQPPFGNPAQPHPAEGEAPRPEADSGERPSPYRHGSPDHRPGTPIRWRGTTWGWEQGPQRGCAAQMDSNRQRFQVFLQCSSQHRVKAINTPIPGQK